MISVEAVLELYSREIAKDFGNYFLRDRGMLESALASPDASYDGVELYPRLNEKIAILIFKVGKNHAFSDGNKRLAWLLGTIYAHLNGYSIDADPVEAYEQINKLMGEHSLTSEFTSWLNNALTLCYKS